MYRTKQWMCSKLSMPLESSYNIISPHPVALLFTSYLKSLFIYMYKCGLHKASAVKDLQ